MERNGQKLALGADTFLRQPEPNPSGSHDYLLHLERSPVGLAHSSKVGLRSLGILERHYCVLKPSEIGRTNSRTEG